jgi:polysaccharide export outer membrane protein
LFWKRRKVMLKKILFLTMFFVLFAVNVFAKDYVIGDGDSLQISVWGNSELSLSVVVRPDGKISLPAVGEIKASGLTPLELSEVLESELKKVVKTPIVSIIMNKMNSYIIFVLGQGAPAGRRTLTRETTLLEFLSELGKLDEADLDNSYLVRDKKIIKENFHELFNKGDFRQDIILESNDMLFIPDNFEKRITIVGEISKPTTIPYREGLTILDVILSAGGFTEFAKENDVQILRKGENDVRTVEKVKVKDLMKGALEHNINIMPGDFIIVKESLF